jgi:N-acetylmuramoyl-L-alanine amidase
MATLATVGVVFSSCLMRIEAQPAITSVKIVYEPIVEPITVEENMFHGPYILEETAEVMPISEDIEVIDTYEYPLTEEEIELIALVTMAEAEGESEYGKRLVIDTILNRVDHDRFPDSVEDVIYQKNQFTSMWNGRVDRCYVDEYICDLVRDELETRTNYETVFFTAGGYGKYGQPMFSEGNHYFSSYM